MDGMRWRILILILTVWLPFTQGPIASAEDGQFVIKLDSKESIRAVYEDAGFVFDDAATEANREQYEKECLYGGSAKFGSHLRPISFLGMAYQTSDPEKKLLKLCMAIRPYTEDMARDLCVYLRRPLISNTTGAFEVVCGAKNGSSPSSG